MTLLRPIVLALLAAAPLAAAEPDPAVLRASAWQLPAAYTTDTGARAKTLLNGFWLRRPVAGGAAEQVRVPDWEGPADGHVLSREVEIPAAWAGRRLWLSGPGAAITVTFTGRPATCVAGRGFDLGLATAGWQRLEVATGRLNADCWLEAEPTLPAITDTYLRTIFRGGPQARLLASGRATAGAKLHLAVDIREQPTGKTLKTFAAEIAAGADGTWQAEPAVAWDLKLWSRWHPNLYWYTATLSDTQGRMMDATLPQRFGFKESWVEDGRVMINGIPTSVIGDSCTRWGMWVFQRDGNVNVRQTREQMRLFKSLGLSGMDSQIPALLDLADEEGWLTHGAIGGLVRDVNVWDPGSGLTQMAGKETEDDIRRNVGSLRQHPSVVGYGTWTVYSLAMMHPEMVGRPYPTWESFPLNRSPERSRAAYAASVRVRDIARPLDPDRWVNLPDGPEGVYDGGTRYLCDNLDLQECEDYFGFWHRTERRKAVGIAEYGIPFDGHLFLRRIDHQMPHTGAWPTIHTENAARWFGPSVYGIESDAALRGWPTQGYAGILASPVTRRMQAMSITAYLRAWRTYGIDLFGHHILDLGAERAREPLPAGPAEDDPRIPGYSRPAPLWSLGHPELAPWTEMGRAYLAAATPLLGFIGGADGRFTAKDHLFTSGAPVRKALIVVNDYDDPAQVQATWTLGDANGKVVATGSVQAGVQAGARELSALTIAFPAPEVGARSDFILKVAGSADRPGNLSDEFRITVFPRTPAARPTFRGQVWRLNISDDYTHESPHFFINRDNETFLAAAGITSRLVKGLKEFTWRGYSPDAAAAAHDPKQRPLVTEGEPMPGDLLIIPRQTLGTGIDDRQTCLRLLQSMDLDRRIVEGLDVVILEQDLANVFGVNTEDTRPRRVFSAAPGHPVLAGLTDEDMSYWSGDSDLQDAITPYSSSLRRFPERMYHSSNRNAVASRTFIRPQIGACRALLVSGFDLQESPLLEITRGKGRIILCSLDVTNRYGKDPAATRLVDNLFAYLADAPRPDPGKAAVEVATAGDHGVTEATTVRLTRPEGNLGWGITAGEMLLREQIFAPAPGRPLPVFLGNTTVHVEAGSVRTTLSPELFATGWARRKAAWVLAALMINHGGSSTQGPSLRYHGQQLALYPHAWVENFVHPYTSDIW